MIKLQNFSLERILEEQLYFFLPFYILRFEKGFKKMEEETREMEPLLAELGKIFDILNCLCDKKILSFYEECTLQDMLKLVAEAVTKKYPQVQKGVMYFMGGKVVEGELMRRYEEVSRQGRAEGRERELVETSQDLGAGYEDTRNRLMTKFSLSQTDADARMKSYWKE